MSHQLALFSPPQARLGAGVPPSFYDQVDLATSPQFCAEILRIFEQHQGQWSSTFNVALWAPFRANAIGSRFAYTMHALRGRLESRNEYFGSKAIGPDYQGFSTAYRLAGTGDGNLDDVEYTHTKPITGPKQKRIAA